MTEKVDGKQYTSNLTKLLFHVDKLADLQRGKSSPVMVHIAPTGVCNLTCDYCCYANRDEGEVLDKEKVKSALEQFRELGTKGVEFTGGGDPSMYPHLDEVVEYAHDLGFDQGLISNGLKTPYFKRFDLLQWMRLSFHAPTVGIPLEPAIKRIKDSAPDMDLTGVYIWTKGSEKVFDEVVRLTEKYEIPTRVTPDLTVGNDFINKAMPYIVNKVRDSGGSFVFASDFNVKTTRDNDHCYMHNIKPFVFHDGNVYVCPSAALSPDNHLNVNDRFKVCSIDEILETYKSLSPGKGIMRNHDCSFCKYAPQNELIDETMKDVKHPNFA